MSIERNEFLDSLETVLDYLYEDEKSHVEEELGKELKAFDKTNLKVLKDRDLENHIFYHILKCKEYVKIMKDKKDLDVDYSEGIKKNFYNLKIRLFEYKYKAKYLGDFPHIKADGKDYHNHPVSVFYRKNPKAGEAQYLGIIIKAEQVLLLDASFILKYKIPALFYMKKTLISTYRNDYVKYRNVFIDGGLDYINSNKIKEVFFIKVVKNELRRI